MANLANLNPHSYHIAECHNEGGLQCFSSDCCRSTFWPVVVRTLTLARILSDRTLWLIGHVHQLFHRSELHSQFSLHTRIFSLLIAHLHHWPPRKMEFTCKNSKRDNAQLSENWTYEGKILERKVWFRTSRMAFRKTLLISRSSNDAESSLVVQQTSQDAIPRNFISIWSESKKISEQARGPSTLDGITTWAGCCSWFSNLWLALWYYLTPHLEYSIEAAIQWGYAYGI